MTTIEQDAQDILSKFKGFTDGVRVLFLIHRTKEGGKNSRNDKLKKVVTRNTEEYGIALVDLLNEQYKARLEGKTLRIYASVNARNIEKAIRTFKYNQLDADFYDQENRHRFYYDIKNRFISALMQPCNKATSHFLIDVDRGANTNELFNKLEPIDGELLLHYPTRNGHHLVTTPFNPSLIQLENVSINKDGLLLLAY